MQSGEQAKQALVVHSSFHLMVLNAAIILWLAPEWIGSFFQRPESGAVNHDRGSHAVLVISLIAGIFAAWCCVNFVPAATVVWQQKSIFWLGIVLMLGGIAFRWYAIRVLGQFFTRDVSMRDGQTVVERGPYRWIRHPSYTGALLTVFGFGLAMTSWLALLAAMLGAMIGYGYRAWRRIPSLHATHPAFYTADLVTDDTSSDHGGYSRHPGRHHT